MQFKLNNYHYNTSDQELIDDMKLVASNLGRNNLTTREYDEFGKYTSGTIHRRLGSWTNALEKAGLTVTVIRNRSDKELFENIERVWISLGRQPTDREMKQPLSNYSKNPYLTRFGTWRNALQAFVEFINSDHQEVNEDNKNQTDVSADKPTEKEIVFKHKTKRNPSERLKVQVLMRDGNKCRLCGITVTGENIHFDHILAWSKGGETTLENIQVLCETHNLAKGNVGYNDV